jgi:hypothetical protein
MEQGHFWGAKSHSVCQEILRIFRNPKVQCCVHLSPPNPRSCVTFRKKLDFYSKGLLAPRTTPKLKDDGTAMCNSAVSKNTGNLGPLDAITTKQYG